MSILLYRFSFWDFHELDDSHVPQYIDEHDTHLCSEWPKIGQALNALGQPSK